MWQSPGPLPDSERTQTLEVGRSCYELKPCQREIASNEIQEKKYRESSNIKARVSDGLSATQNGLGWQIVSAPCKHLTHIAELTVTHVNYWAIGSYQSTEQTLYMTVVSHNLELIFALPLILQSKFSIVFWNSLR